MKVIRCNQSSSFDTSKLSKENIDNMVRERKEEIIKPLEDVLAKFETVRISQCLIGDENVIVQLTVADASVIRDLLNVFFNGSEPWKVTIANWPASQENENRVFFSAHFCTKEYKTEEDIFGFDNIKREIDYKICLLKSALGG